ncbi:MAG: zinc-ribbon domain-containing protein [Bacteroidales bacterium]|nr:zinc-ribbon domain-containing protein [Bacteroidales bacterium]
MDTKICTACGKEIPANVKFCIICGAKQPEQNQETHATASGSATDKICPNCGNEVKTTDIFCIKCGTRLKERNEETVCKPAASDTPNAPASTPASTPAAPSAPASKPEISARTEEQRTAIPGTNEKAERCFDQSFDLQLSKGEQLKLARHAAELDPTNQSYQDRVDFLDKEISSSRRKRITGFIILGVVVQIVIGVLFVLLISHGSHYRSYNYDELYNYDTSSYDDDNYTTDDDETTFDDIESILEEAEFEEDWSDYVDDESDEDW